MAQTPFGLSFTGLRGIRDEASRRHGVSIARLDRLSANVGRGHPRKNVERAYRSFETRRVIIFATGKEEGASRAPPLAEKSALGSRFTRKNHVGRSAISAPTIGHLLSSVSRIMANGQLMFIDGAIR